MKYTTIRISVPTESDLIYLKMLTPRQRLVSLVHAGKQHLDDVQKGNRLVIEMSFGDLEDYARKGMALIATRHNDDGYYWLETPSSEDDRVIGGASDFYDQNDIEFDASGDPVEPLPSQDTVLVAKFRID